MAGNAELIHNVPLLYNEKRVALGEDNTEYVAIGADPVIFRPVLQIHANNNGLKAFVSLAPEHLWTFLSKLRSKMDGDTWSIDTTDESGVSIVTLDNYETYRFKDKSGEMTLSDNTAYILAYQKGLQLIKAAHSYMKEYRRIKPVLKKLKLPIIQKFCSFSPLRVNDEYIEGVTENEHKDLARYFGAEN